MIWRRSGSGSKNWSWPCDLARARNRELREELHERLNQFNRTARATLIGTVYAKALPKVPPVTGGGIRICLAFHELNILWKSLNTSAVAGMCLVSTGR